LRKFREVVLEASDDGNAGAIGGVQKGSRSIPAVDHQVVGKASAQLAPGSGEQALAGGILAVARAVGFGVEGKRQAGSDDADADHLVGVTDHFFLGVVLRTAKLATSVNAVSGGGAIDARPTNRESWKALLRLAR